MRLRTSKIAEIHVQAIYNLQFISTLESLEFSSITSIGSYKILSEEKIKLVEILHKSQISPFGFLRLTRATLLSLAADDRRFRLFLTPSSPSSSDADQSGSSSSSSTKSYTSSLMASDDDESDDDEEEEDDDEDDDIVRRFKTGFLVGKSLVTTADGSAEIESK
uniref:Uncharacterized protein n=1 Tax=Romanomermis culicivorax TaxID=13658 RepID=A0A915IAD4_ROMCU